MFSTIKKTFLSKIFLSILAISLIAGCSTSQAVKRADKKAASGDWDEAVLIYTEAVKKDPENVGYIMKYRNARVESSRSHHERGVRLTESKDYDSALIEFQVAAILDPTNKKAEEDVKRTKNTIDSLYFYGKGVDALNKGNIKEARNSFKKSVSLDPKNSASSAELDKLSKDAGIMMDGVMLDIKSATPITLEFKDAGLKNIFSVLSKLSGINFIFDSDLRDTRSSIFLKDATFKQALDLLLQTNNVSKKVVSENTIIIYPASPAKDKQYEDLMIRVFYLDNIDAKKAVNLIRSMVKAKDIYVHDELNALVIRGKPASIDLAEKILYATDKADAEVVLAVEIMEVSKSKNYNLGLAIPDAIGVNVPNPDTYGYADSPRGLLASNFGSQLVGSKMLFTLPPGVINLKSKDGSTEILANPKIRVKNNAKAKIHIGERVPIITATVSGTTDTRTENVQYQDVGVKLNVEPTVRPNDEIDLKLGLEVSTLGEKTVTQSGSVVYQIGTRNVETILRLYDGETQVIGGLITDEERKGRIKIPGLGDIPLVGSLFASNTGDKVNSEILLAITPHIVRRVDVPSAEEGSFWSGREDDPSAAGVVTYTDTAPVAYDTAPGVMPVQPGSGSPSDDSDKFGAPPLPPPPMTMPTPFSPGGAPAPQRRTP
ncbi:MAG: secretin and TonB N-terminal domain-containing protein [Deltaproteobacteria bacterium]|nr:secretin and TonB N-terminal domain-containing protein [Deltaproteobacteria bacterium]